MKELGLVLGGVLIGYGLEGTWWRVKDSLWPGVQRAWKWAKARGRRDPRQWFRRSEAARPAPPLPPGAVPGPRPVVGQRASEGAHRATQRQARFGHRSFRSRQ